MRWDAIAKQRNMNYNSLHEGTDVIRGGKLQSHVISAMGLVQSPIRTLHQPPLGIINHLGRKASMSEKISDLHWSLAPLPGGLFSLSALTKFQPWQIIHYDIQRWNIHATCHGMACPSVFKYSNLRQVSRPKYEISVSPCDTKSGGWNIQVPATCHTNFQPKLLSSQILRRDLNTDKSFSRHQLQNSIEL